MRRICMSCWLSVVVALYLCSCDDPDNKIVQAEITYFSVWDQRTVNHVLHVDNVNLYHNQ
jgi:hypothetical protein